MNKFVCKVTDPTIFSCTFKKVAEKGLRRKTFYFIVLVISANAGMLQQMPGLWTAVCRQKKLLY